MSVPLVFKPNKVTCPPRIRPEGWTTQYAVLTTHCPGKISTCIITYLSRFPSWGHRSWPDHFSSFPTWLCDGKYPWQVPIHNWHCQSPFSFQDVHVFLMCSWGEVRSESYSTNLIASSLDCILYKWQYQRCSLCWKWNCSYVGVVLDYIRKITKYLDTIMSVIYF